MQSRLLCLTSVYKSICGQALALPYIHLTSTWYRACDECSQDFSIIHCLLLLTNIIVDAYQICLHYLGIYAAFPVVDWKEKKILYNANYFPDKHVKLPILLLRGRGGLEYLHFRTLDSQVTTVVLLYSPRWLSSESSINVRLSSHEWDRDSIPVTWWPYDIITWSHDHQMTVMWLYHLIHSN